MSELEGHELFARAVPLARRLVYSRRYPPGVDVDDLLGAVYERLLRHVGRYDPTRGAFDNFAAAHTRGAVRDQMRAVDPLKHDRRRANRVARVTQQLWHELGRAPEQDEIAGRMGISPEALLTVPAWLDLGEADSPTPDARLLERERLRPLSEALSMLAPRPRRCVELYYWHDWTQAEIGDELGVSESRVCQLLGNAAERLRELLVSGPHRAASKCAPRGVCEIGARFGCWTVLAHIRTPNGKRGAFALCRCHCGAERIRPLKKIRYDAPRRCARCWREPRV